MKPARLAATTAAIFGLAAMLVLETPDWVAAQEADVLGVPAGYLTDESAPNRCPPICRGYDMVYTGRWMPVPSGGDACLCTSKPHGKPNPPD